MEPDIKSAVHELLELTRENNKLLRKMHRAQAWGRFFSFLYWIIIIAVMIGAYYYVQPYINAMLEAYGVIQTQLNSVSELGNKIPDLSGLEDLNGSLQGLFGR